MACDLTSATNPATSMTATSYLSMAHAATLPCEAMIDSDAQTTPAPGHDPPSELPVAVAFDVGETLIDETRLWCRWADRLGVTRLTFLGVLGAMAAAGRPHRDAFDLVRPGIDVDEEIASWAADDPTGLRENFDRDDLYFDVRRCFARLNDQGFRVVIAGNQPVQARQALDDMGLSVDSILISDELGVQKPDPAFFDAIADVVGTEPAQIAYVGDRVDNDAVPARRAGMRAVLVRRGPWGYLQATWPEAAQADHVIDSLDELPDVFARRRRPAR